MASEEAALTVELAVESPGDGGGAAATGAGGESLTPGPGAAAAASDAAAASEAGPSSQAGREDLLLLQQQQQQHALLAAGRQLSSTKDVIISVREKHGSFRSAVPCMPMPLALVCCFLNLFLPGVGTLVSCFSLFCCGLTRMSTQRAFFWNLLAAILQTVTSIFIVGWIWSISWGLTFCTLATEYRYEKQARSKQHKTTRWAPT